MALGTEAFSIGAYDGDECQEKGVDKGYYGSPGATLRITIMYLLSAPTKKLYICLHTVLLNHGLKESCVVYGSHTSFVIIASCPYRDYTCICSSLHVEFLRDLRRGCEGEPYTTFVG